MLKRTLTQHIVEPPKQQRKRIPLTKKSNSLASILKMEQPNTSKPLLVPPESPPDEYEPAKWEFPPVVKESFDLEPDFLKVQVDFSLSKLVNAMTNHS